MSDFQCISPAIKSSKKKHYPSGAAWSGLAGTAAAAAGAGAVVVAGAGAGAGAGASADAAAGAGAGADAAAGAGAGADATAGAGAGAGLDSKKGQQSLLIYLLQSWLMHLILVFSHKMLLLDVDHITPVLTALHSFDFRILLLIFKALHFIIWNLFVSCRAQSFIVIAM